MINDEDVIYDSYGFRAVALTSQNIDRYYKNRNYCSYILGEEDTATGERKILINKEGVARDRLYEHLNNKDAPQFFVPRSKFPKP